MIIITLRDSKKKENHLPLTHSHKGIFPSPSPTLEPAQPAPAEDNPISIVLIPEAHRHQICRLVNASTTHLSPHCKGLVGWVAMKQ